MVQSRKRLLMLLAALPILILVSALIYMWLMNEVEGDERTFLQAFEFAAETLSTTGYGRDSSWDHPLLVMFVVVLQFFGVFLIFLIFPIYLIPFLEERFEARLPKEAPEVEEGTIVIYQSGPAVASLRGRRCHGSAGSGAGARPGGTGGCGRGRQRQRHPVRHGDPQGLRPRGASTRLRTSRGSTARVPTSRSPSARSRARSWPAAC